MNKKFLCTILICVIAVLFMGCGDKYSDAVKVNHQFAEATEEYVNTLEKADSAEAVASAVNDYADEVEKIAPKIRDIAEKYPDLRSRSEVPEELGKSRKKVEEASKKMGSTMMNMMKYMGDPQVVEAYTRLQNAMGQMAPIKK